MRKYITFDDITPTINEINEKINLIPIIPSGIIMIWSGDSSNIPEGWVLCDGDNGTPNLSDKFVIAAGTDYPASSTGGESEVTLTVAQMPSHMHDVVAKDGTGDKGICASNEEDGTNGYNWSFADTSNDGDNNRSGLFKAATVGGDGAHNNMPPYYSLCYIMKL